MTPLQLTLVLHIITTYLGTSSLPITSKPLDDSPDHLTWEAWLMVDSKNPYETQGKVRKIPKSIFITPNRGNESNVVCEPGYKMGPKATCVKIVVINQNDLLESQIQSVFGGGQTTKNDEDDFDYEYEDADASTNSEPFHVNIPLSVNDDNDDDSREVFGPISDKVYNVGGDQDVATTTASPTITTTTLKPSSTTANTKLSDNVFPGTDPLAMAASQTIASTTATTSTKHPAPATPTAAGSAIASTAASTAAAPTTDASLLGNVATISNDTSSSTKHFNSTLEVKQNATISDEIILLSDQEEDSDNLTEFDTTTATNDDIKHETDQLTQDEADAFKEALESESLIESGTTINYDSSDSEGTTEILIETTTSQNIIEDIIKVSDKLEDVLKTLHTDTHPTTPSIYDKTLLQVDQESDVNKRNRESLMQHEIKQTALENIDTNNRFVYHHLGSDSNRHSNSLVTTPRAPEATTEDILEQLSAINRLIQQNRRSQEDRHRFRFPDHHDHLLPADRRTDEPLRFPGQATGSHTPFAHRNHVHTVDQLTKRPSSEERTPLWWVPTSWEADKTGPKPMLLRFWSHSPANNANNGFQESGRQASATTAGGNSERANSRRPTENLFKEMTASDVYKVFQSRSSERDS